ncbi:hypothetical protein HDU96_008011 [Phlyctochytrium bullatum]|nr:hypothetical protein HDU96_008011 [Phlyctochytrium bullatum]
MLSLHYDNAAPQGQAKYQQHPPGSRASTPQRQDGGNAFETSPPTYSSGNGTSSSALAALRLRLYFGVDSPKSLHQLNMNSSANTPAASSAVASPSHAASAGSAHVAEPPAATNAHSDVETLPRNASESSPPITPLRSQKWGEPAPCDDSPSTGSRWSKRSMGSGSRPGKAQVYQIRRLDVPEGEATSPAHPSSKRTSGSTRSSSPVGGTPGRPRKASDASIVSSALSSGATRVNEWIRELPADPASFTATSSLGRNSRPNNNRAKYLSKASSSSAEAALPSSSSSSSTTSPKNSGLRSRSRSRTRSAAPRRVESMSNLVHAIAGGLAPPQPPATPRAPPALKTVFTVAVPAPPETATTATTATSTAYSSNAPDTLPFAPPTLGRCEKPQQPASPTSSFSETMPKPVPPGVFDPPAAPPPPTNPSNPPSGRARTLSMPLFPPGTVAVPFPVPQAPVPSWGVPQQQWMPPPPAAPYSALAAQYEAAQYELFHPAAAAAGARRPVSMGTPLAATDGFFPDPPLVVLPARVQREGLVAVPPVLPPALPPARPPAVELVLPPAAPQQEQPGRATNALQRGWRRLFGGGSVEADKVPTPPSSEASSQQTTRQRQRLSQGSSTTTQMAGPGPGPLAGNRQHHQQAGSVWGKARAAFTGGDAPRRGRSLGRRESASEAGGAAWDAASVATVSTAVGGATERQSSRKGLRRMGSIKWLRGGNGAGGDDEEEERGRGRGRDRSRDPQPPPPVPASSFDVGGRGAAHHRSRSLPPPQASTPVLGPILSMPPPPLPPMPAPYTPAMPGSAQSSWRQEAPAASTLAPPAVVVPEDEALWQVVCNYADMGAGAGIPDDGGESIAGAAPAAEPGRAGSELGLTPVMFDAGWGATTATPAPPPPRTRPSAAVVATPVLSAAAVPTVKLAAVTSLHPAHLRVPGRVERLSFESEERNESVVGGEETVGSLRKRDGMGIVIARRSFLDEEERGAWWN